MKITNAQLKQIIKEELEKVLEEQSTVKMAQEYPGLYSKEQRVLLNKLLSGEITVQDLNDYQLELMNQKTDYLAQGAFSSGYNMSDARDAAEYHVWKAIDKELENRRNQKGSQFHNVPSNYSL